MTVTLFASASRPRFLNRRQVGRPVTVVVRRRRRTLAVLTTVAAGLWALAFTLQSQPLLGLALAAVVLDVSYLALVRRVTSTKARHDMATAFRAQPVLDDAFWREIRREMPASRYVDERLAPPVARVENTALACFVLGYFLGWALTPIVGLIRLLRGDLAGIEQSRLLGQIVALQRRGRSQSLRLLVAGASTVAVAGGGTATTLLMAPGIAGAASTGQAYVVHPGDTLSGIAERYEMSVSSLAEVNGIGDPNVIVPGEVIKLVGIAPSGEPYTIVPGDTLAAIATRFGTTVTALVSLNNIPDPNLIFAGATLRLPSGAVTATVAPRSYTVQAGDTLQSIAFRFGLNVAALAAANGIANPNFIEVGQVLDLRATSRATAAVSAPVSSGYVNPFAIGSWSPGRIDQGVDWAPNVTSPVVAIGNGVITYSSMRSGWPGGGFISYRLTSGSHAGLYVYVAEHITDLLPLGTVVSAGEQIATALPGFPWTEWGWAAASGPAPAPGSQYHGAPDGTQTAGGKAFARFLISLGVSGVENPGPGPTTP